MSWEDGEPILEGQLDMGINVAALGEVLIAAGEEERGRALLVELLADTDVQVKRYGRGENWLNEGRAMAYALLGRPDEAMATLQRQAKLGFLFHNCDVALEKDPAYDSLRGRKDFQALLKAAREVEAQEHEKFLKMRKEGQVPNRG